MYNDILLLTYFYLLPNLCFPLYLLKGIFFLFRILLRYMLLIYPLYKKFQCFFYALT